jgi:3-hydroxyisobutyrate dehydrogenase-like beta-hydroxyacid dehydrogenase
VKPYTIGVMGRETIEYADAEPGKASVMKLMGNTFVVNMVEGLAQGLTMAEKSGLGTENVLKFVGLFFPDSPYLPYAKRMLEGAYFKQAVS